MIKILDYETGKEVFVNVEVSHSNFDIYNFQINEENNFNQNKKKIKDLIKIIELIPIKNKITGRIFN